MRIRNVLLATALAASALALTELAITHALNGSQPVVTTSGAPAIGGPFSLIDQNGAPVTQATLAGKPSVLYFGYTYCPEACPTTLSDLSRWIAQLGPDADRLNYAFVTIDPDRDTPKVMKEYLQSFDKRIQGFTGMSQQVAEIAKAYKVYYKKVPTGDSYLMDHSTMIYLMGQNGRFEGLIPYQDNDADALAKLKALVAGDEGS